MKTPQDWTTLLIADFDHEDTKYTEECTLYWVNAIMQAQHEVTWAMAIEAAKAVCKENEQEFTGERNDTQGGYVIACCHCAEEIAAIACPPLQTTNESKN